MAVSLISHPQKVLDKLREDFHIPAPEGTTKIIVELDFNECITTVTNTTLSTVKERNNDRDSKKTV